MSGFVIRFASVMCLLVILTGPSSALFWRPARPTYPSNANDPYYKAFQTVPSPAVTAKKFMTNFLGLTSYKQQLQGDATSNLKRQANIEDIVIVMDGSGSVGRCEFSKGKKALKHMMTTLHNPQYDSKYAAVTFASRATVDFRFLPYSSAGSRITRISYPSGMTNTQAGLAKAKTLFEDPSSGRRPYPTRKMVFLLTDGRSNIRSDLTIPKADALKRIGVDIYVVAVGSYIHGINEIVQVASYPPQKYLFRVKRVAGFWKIIQLIVRMVSPQNYQVVNYNPPC